MRYASNMQCGQCAARRRAGIEDMAKLVGDEWRRDSQNMRAQISATQSVQCAWSKVRLRVSNGRNEKRALLRAGTWEHCTAVRSRGRSHAPAVRGRGAAVCMT